jgi:predicted hydrolase (HD superfamily)
MCIDQFDPPSDNSQGESRNPSETNRFDRDAAWQLLCSWTQGESLRKHAMAVAVCTTAYGEVEADRLGLSGESRDAFIGLYATTGLLHDFDYEKHPTAEEHPFVGVRELQRLGWPTEMQTAILGHAQYSGVPRVTHLDKALFACDELAEFLTACALVKPTREIADVEVVSVRKKMKDKAFARAVSRDDIRLGAEELCVDLNTHIGFCLQAMKYRATELGL